MNTGIEIKLSFCWFNIASWFTKPIMIIDDKDQYQRKWGTHFFELPKGEYKIEIVVPYLNLSKSYKVSIKNGEIVKLSFFANPLKATI